MEKPVRFQSKGENLFGIFHAAKNNSKKVGVILLNAGLQYRVGPHRIYIKTARRLNQLGFATLRMDCTGIGDSKGEVREIHFDFSDTEDTLRAVDFLTQEEKIEKVVLLGICGGARNALRASVKDPRVDSIVLWSLPFISISPGLPAGKIDPRRSISNVIAKETFKGWMKKVLSIKAWNRFLFYNRRSFSIVNVLRALLTREKNSESTMHREFIEAFESFPLSKRMALVVYGEKDLIPKKEFEAKFKELPNNKKQVYECYIVPNGTHTFNSIESEKDVIDKTVKWLIQQYKVKKEQLLHTTKF